jgi:hypothetical protein
MLRGGLKPVPTLALLVAAGNPRKQINNGLSPRILCHNATVLPSSPMHHPTSDAVRCMKYVRNSLTAAGRKKAASNALQCCAITRCVLERRHIAKRTRDKHAQKTSHFLIMIFSSNTKKNARMQSLGQPLPD